jgi:transposase
MGAEVIEVVERRRRWPVETKLKVLDDVLRSSASISAVADRHGVSRGLVYQWLRQVREGRLAGLSVKPEAAAFAPVRVQPTTSQPATPPQPATGLARSPRAPRRLSTSIEIALANGRVVKVEEGVDPVALAAIVAALDVGDA